MPSRRRAGPSSVAATRATASWTLPIAVRKSHPCAAASMSVLDGTQPTNVQSPPGGPSLTNAVLAPALTPARAAAIPAAPPPITSRS